MQLQALAHELRTAGPALPSSAVVAYVNNAFGSPYRIGLSIDEVLVSLMVARGLYGAEGLNVSVHEALERWAMSELARVGEMAARLKVLVGDGVHVQSLMGEALDLYRDASALLALVSSTVEGGLQLEHGAWEFAGVTLDDETDVLANRMNRQLARAVESMLRMRPGALMVPDLHGHTISAVMSNIEAFASHLAGER